jgi:polyisoprenyl-phosphate glycosyltransferase
MDKLKLTVLAPVYNEADVIAHFHARTRAVLEGISDVDATILFVVDRSSDNTLEVLRDVVARDANAKVIALSSRFGHQMSLLAGIENSLEADAIVMMDSDLQHPPELIPTLLEEFRAGHDVVYTVREDTENVSAVRKALGNVFYRLLKRLSSVQINANAADFRLISKRVAQLLASDFRERNMFLRGLFSWIGFKQKAVPFVAAARFAGRSKYSFSRILNLASTGVLAFSTKPLQAGIFVGIGFAGLAFALLLGAVVAYFLDSKIPSGWTTLVALLLLFSGIQLIVLGVMGAYIGGIYEEVKSRPRYIIDEVIEHQADRTP